MAFFPGYNRKLFKGVFKMKKDWIALAKKDGAYMTLAAEPDKHGNPLHECHKYGEVFGYIDTTPQMAARQYCEDHSI